MDRLRLVPPPSHSDAARCPECESAEIDTQYEDRPVRHGAKDNVIEISARVPVRRCRNCKLEFTDEVAETLQHEAICTLRERHGLNREEFAQLTGLGEATIARWESGVILQNTGNDRYLRLLEHSANIDLLRRCSGTGKAEEKVGSVKGKKAKMSSKEDLKRKAAEARRVAEEARLKAEAAEAELEAQAGSDLEEEFRKLYSTVGNQIRMHVEAASGSLAAAEKLADLHKIPFTSSVSRLHQSYVPSGCSTRWEDIADVVMQFQLQQLT